MNGEIIFKVESLHTHLHPQHKRGRLIEQICHGRSMAICCAFIAVNGVAIGRCSGRGRRWFRWCFPCPSGRFAMFQWFGKEPKEDIALASLVHSQITRIRTNDVVEDWRGARQILRDREELKRLNILSFIWPERLFRALCRPSLLG